MISFRCSDSSLEIFIVSVYGPHHTWSFCVARKPAASAVFGRLSNEGEIENGRIGFGLFSLMSNRSAARFCNFLSSAAFNPGPAGVPESLPGMDSNLGMSP